MRAFRLLVVACGLVLLLTACASSPTGDGNAAGSSSSGRAIFREGRSSAGSDASAGTSSRAASASAQSSKAPFFSLKSSSSAAATSSVRAPLAVGSSAGSAGTVAASRTKLYVEADRTEVRPGDPVTLSVTVKNTSSVTIASMQVVTSYLPSQLVVADSAGSQAGNSVWTIQSLAPNQKRTLRIPATVAATVAAGDVIRTNTIAAINNVVEPNAYPYQFTIVSELPLPQTGASDALSPLENTRRFLTPFRGNGSVPAMPIIVWTATIGMGIALGMKGMKRYL